MNPIENQPKNGSRVIDLYHNEGKDVKAMSIEELRASEHYKHCSDEELINMIDTVRTFTELVYSAWSKQSQQSKQASTVISLHNQQSKAA